MKSRPPRSTYLVRDWMSTNPITIPLGATLADAYDCMMECDLRRLPVVDAQGDLLGIITLSDILQVIPPLQEMTGEGAMHVPLLSDLPVREIMAWDPVTITPSDSIRNAAQRMLEYQVSGLPVLEGDQLVGIITESDIFRLVVECLDERRLHRERSAS